MKTGHSSQTKAQRAEWLRDNCHMKGLDARDCQMLNEIVNAVHVHRGEFLFEEGERENAIYLVRSGRVELGHTTSRHRWVDFGAFGEVDLDETGDEPHWLRKVTLSSGDCAGEPNLFDQRPHALTAWVSEDGELLSVNARALKALCSRNPHLHQCVSESLKQLMMQV